MFNNIWPWSAIAAARIEANLQMQCADIYKRRAFDAEQLLRRAYFRDPKTGRLMAKGVRPE